MILDEEAKALITIAEKITPHNFNNYLSASVGNKTTIEFDVKAKAWFWSDRNLDRKPLDLFFAEFILSLETLVSGWDNHPIGISTKILPNNTEAKYHIHRRDDKTTITFGFTDYVNSVQSGELYLNEFRTLIRIVRTIFGDFIYEDHTQRST